MEKKDYKLVVVLGNGFDIDLGLKTKYTQYMGHDIFKSYLENPKYGRPNAPGVVLFNKFKDKIKLNHWIDIEKELAKFSQKKYNKKTQVPFSMEDYEIEDLEEGFKLLHKTLTEYLKTLSYDELKKDSYAAQLLEIIKKYYFDFEILSFNYTDLNHIANKLGILSDSDNHEELDCVHIHGSLKNNDIIIGFEDDLDIYDSCSFMIKSFSQHYKSNNVRNTLLDADEVIFFGHSLGSSDYHYFSDLFKRQSDATKANNDMIIRIFTYDEQSRRDILLQLRNMNERRTNYLYDLCHLEIYRTKDNIDDVKIEKYFKELEKRITDYMVSVEMSKIDTVRF